MKVLKIKGVLIEGVLQTTPLLFKEGQALTEVNAGVVIP
jgi:hypothetical protein